MSSTLSVVEIKRNKSIDLIKVIAMMMVMALHTCLGRLDNPVAFVLSRTSGIAIPLFFMVSGFLLWGKTTNYGYSIHKIGKIIRFVFLFSLIYYLGVILYKGYHWEDFPRLFLGSFLQKGDLGIFWYFGAMIFLYGLLPIINKLDIKLEYFHISLVILLLCIVFIFHQLNITEKWEKIHVLQTFRLWNWLFYFSLGGMLRKIYKENFQYMEINLSKILLPLIFCIWLLFILYVFLMKKQVGGIEYFFGSPLCWCYAVLIFIYCLHLKVDNNKFLEGMSSLFLPVYALHMPIVRMTSGKIDSLGIIAPVVDYIIVVFLTVLFSYFIMKQSYLSKIFQL